jgi:hypothetical protein
LVRELLMASRDAFVIDLRKLGLWNLLSFWVTSKVFTQCFGCFMRFGVHGVFNPWMVRDGLAHGRWSMMDFA